MAIADQLHEILAKRPMLAWHPMDRAELIEWRGQVRAAVRALAGVSTVLPLKLEGYQEHPAEDLLIREYVFRNPMNGLKVRAQLFVPGDVRDDYPLILFCQGRYWPEQRGVELATFGTYELARNGFRTLMLDYGVLNGWSSEKVGARDEINLLGLALGLVATSPLALIVQNALAALAWLGEQPWLDRDKVVLFGRSLGGQIALHISLAHAQDLRVALSSCIGRYPTMYAENLSVGAAHGLPGILNIVDIPDLLAAVCPNPLYIQLGTADYTMPFEDAEAALLPVKQSFEVMQATDQLCCDVIAGKGHPTSIPAVVAYLKSVCAETAFDSGQPALREL